MEKHADVFISYHMKTASDVVKEISSALEKEGVQCWYCERDGRGSRESWPAQVVKAIQNCHIFLLILDQGAVSQTGQTDNIHNEVYQELLNAWSCTPCPEILFFNLAESGAKGSLFEYYMAGRTMDGKTPGGGLRIKELVDRIQDYLSEKERLEDRKEKVFRDTVHGYISIPEDYVKNFIDTPLFQRLREVEQTGMRVLYPAARHDRFVHSLGVYHLGRKAFAHFRRNAARDFTNTHFRLRDNPRENKRCWDRCGMLFEIACLLHDCGHAPFSHTLEAFFDMEYPGQTSLTEKLAEQFPSSSFFQDDLKKNEKGSMGAPHERMSALLVCTEYGKAIRTLLVRYGLYDADETDPLEFIVRAIIGCPYQCAKKEDDRSLSPSEQIGNCLISLLNSESIDVDSMDYIIRDAQMSGIDNMSIDVDRLLNALTLSEITRVKNYKFKTDDGKEGITILSGRLSESGGKKAQFDGSIQGGLSAGPDCEAEIKSGYIDLRGFVKIQKAVKIKGTVKVNGAEFTGKLPNITDPATVEMRGILQNPLKITGNFQMFSRTNARVKLSAGFIAFDNAEDTSSSYVNGSMQGSFTGSLLGNWGMLNAEKVSVECRLGFHKSSLSVIQNVVIARNQEYQWVFSHHKVVYQANYLLVELLRQCVQYLSQKKQTSGGRDPLSTILSWECMVSPPDGGPHETLGTWFWRPTDADILAIFKRCEIETRMDSNAPSELVQLLDGYASRRYRKSLWKSFAEMDHFLDVFTREEIGDIRKLFERHADADKDDRPKSSKYGYLDDTWKQAFLEAGLDNVVWVDGTSRLKDVDPDKTYLHFKDRDVTYGSVRDPANVRPIKSPDLFYIYYRPVGGHPVERNRLVQFLRRELEEDKRKQKIRRDKTQRK